ncbi:hypothetical protein JZ751_024069 [Albula glossodonta]|uniref:SRCR domain-containing protein n=1 Tax=Albula glossodonta TaxID=121402 RepID=A0A8T2MSB6_9TELE|nr:hypothetical protein JZ751_024069 [Albula glossodonta]
MDKVGCVGNETSLWECPTAEWGQTDCGHKQDVTIVCSEYKQLRLRQEDDTRVCSGLAEVFYNDTWGSLCGNDMTGETATVICRQLGCGDSESYDQKLTSLPLGSPLWVDNIKCGVYDESLWQCSSSPWGDPSSQQELQCPEPTLPPETQPRPSLSIPAVASVVLGALLVLLLVVLGVLVFQNRGLRRGRDRRWEEHDHMVTVTDEASSIVNSVN